MLYLDNRNFFIIIHDYDKLDEKKRHPEDHVYRFSWCRILSGGGVRLSYSIVFENAVGFHPRRFAFIKLAREAEGGIWRP